MHSNKRCLLPRTTETCARETLWKRASTEHTPAGLKKKEEKIDQETEGLGTAIKSESLKLGNDAEPVPGILHLEKARGMSELHLRAHSNYNEPEFHPGSKRRKKTNYFYFIVVFNLSLFFILFWDESIRDILLLTRSRTRENSGVLRVFKGSAGLRVNCSSVSGGTCLMKKYLEFKETKRKYINSQKSQVFKCPSWTFNSNITYLLFLL